MSSFTIEPKGMAASSFRVLVVASIVLGLLGAFVDVLVPNLIPESIASAVEELPLSPAFESSWFIGFVLAYAITMLGGLVGLLFFKRWGRTICLWGSVAGFTLYPLLGPVVYSGLGIAMQDISSILWGAALAVAFFSPLKERFSLGSANA